MLLALVQGLFGAMAFDGESNGARETGAVDASLHQVVLCSFTDRPGRQRLVVNAAQDQHGHIRRMRVQPLKRLEAVAVRERQIRHHQIEAPFAQPLQALRQLVHVRDLEVSRTPLAQQQAEQP